MLSNILPDPVNAYLSDLRFQIVDEINDKKIRTLEDVADAFAQKSTYYVIHFVGSARPAVLERSAVEQARDRILGNYDVHKEQYVEGGLIAMRSLLSHCARFWASSFRCCGARTDAKGRTGTS